MSDNETESNSFHLRITGTFATLEEVIKKYVKKFNPTKYGFWFEKSKSGVEHVHGYLEYQDIPPKQNISNFFKPLLEKREKGGEARYYHKECTTTDEQNLIYCSKCGDVRLTNISKEELEQLKNKNIEIDKDKSTDMRNKILKEFIDSRIEVEKRFVKEEQKLMEEEYDMVHSSEWSAFRSQISEIYSLPVIARFINDLYIHKYKKEPPVNHMRGYVLYVAGSYKSNCESIMTKLNCNIQSYYDRIFYD